MPPKPKTPEQLSHEKAHIIDEAVKLIAKSGLENFSVRQLGRQLGMSAANLYNYFYSKDEINISIRIRGFRLLYNACRKDAPPDNPVRRLTMYVNQFIDFGLLHPEYYQLMLTANEPKYLSYVGTPLEQLAAKEKRSSLRVLNYLEEIIKEISPDQSTEACHIIACRIICEIHGVVSLTHSNMLKEMSVSTQTIRDALLRRLLLEMDPQDHPV